MTVIIISLFTGYGQNAVLADFKEGLRSNLDDRITSLRERDMPAGEVFDATPGIAVLLPFGIPPSSRKPRGATRWGGAARQAEKRFANPAAAARYGLLCGALWIFAFAVFLALGFWIGFAYSRLTFFFAVGGNCWWSTRSPASAYGDFLGKCGSKFTAKMAVSAYEYRFLCIVRNKRERAWVAAPFFGTAAFIRAFYGRSSSPCGAAADHPD